MPSFIFDIDTDDTVRAIYKDGVPINSPTRLEMPTAIVHTYFKSARRSLTLMTDSDENRDDNRLFGIQCFLMSMVGVEAFLNVFFHSVGRGLNLPGVISLANKEKATIEQKLSHLPRQAYGMPLPAQKRLVKKMREFYDLRSRIVHPKWQPSSLVLPGLVIEDLVENEQKAFEDREFCLETLHWCLLVVARVGAHAAGGQPYDYFVKHWTGLDGTNATLSQAVGIPEDGI